MTNITEHFTEEELKCKCGCGQIKINPQLLYGLEVLRRRVNKPININSCYRCVAHNTKVGGEPKSQHLLGNAADITIAGLSTMAIYSIAKHIFTGIGLYKDFIHVDVRDNQALWTAASTNYN